MPAYCNSNGAADAAAPPSGAAAFGTAGCAAAVAHPAAGVQLDPAVAKAVWKQRLLQDKNRRAQARVRERQRVGPHVYSHRRRTSCLQSLWQTASEHDITVSA
jgi:hypothetical protein